MERWVPIVAMILLVAVVVVGHVLWNRRVLRLAEKRYRPEIEAFVAWFLECVSAYDKEAIDEINRIRTPGNEHAFVYLKGGGWFLLGIRSQDGSGKYSLEIHGVGGRSMGIFPPIGTRCDAPWFVDRMIDLQRLIDMWPLEWTRSVRATRVLDGKPDPLYIP